MSLRYETHPRIKSREKQSCFPRIKGKGIQVYPVIFHIGWRRAEKHGMGGRSEIAVEFREIASSVVTVSRLDRESTVKKPWKLV